jgi:hypothetical protein
MLDDARARMATFLDRECAVVNRALAACDFALGWRPVIPAFGHFIADGKSVC